MPSLRNLTPILLVGLLCSNAYGAPTTGDRIADFRLMDQFGASHHLYYFSDKQAVVLLAQDNRCIGMAAASASLDAAIAAHGDGLQGFLINSSLYDDRAGVRSAVQGLATPLPVLLDDAQLVGRHLGLTRAGEALVIDPRQWTLTYRGAANADMHAAIARLTGSAPATSSAAALPADCSVDYPDLQGDRVSYSDTVAPLLAEHCASCHRPGGIGPWAMTDHNMVRGFAPMIKEVLMTQRMPPWHADPEIGHWANDRSLSVAERQALVSWIDAGAPRGTGADPLEQLVSARPAWGALGEPDLVLDIPATDVPATGVVDYQYKYVRNPLDHDVWVRASQIKPGDRAVLHHVITRFGEIESKGPRKGRISRRGVSGGLAGYVPGMEARPLPVGTGTLLPAGATIEFQMHYTTSGKASTDHSQIGIYFHDAAPEHRIHSMILANPRLKIPPHAKAHAEQAMRVFQQDALMYSILPHAHYRGKAARFEAIYPDGQRETLLNVPNYDFNWQTTYLLQQPKFVPAGTRIVYTHWWDNSAQNPANPDPDREVPWGQQSWDEMIFGAISYRELSSTEGQANGQPVAGSD